MPWPSKYCKNDGNLSELIVTSRKKTVSFGARIYWTDKCLVALIQNLHSYRPWYTIDQCVRSGSGKCWYFQVIDHSTQDLPSKFFVSWWQMNRLVAWAAKSSRTDKKELRQCKFTQKSLAVVGWNLTTRPFLSWASLNSRNRICLNIFPVEDLRFNRFRYFSKTYWLKMKCAIGTSNINWLTFSWFSLNPLKQLSKLWRHRSFSYWHWLPWCAAPVQSAASSTKPEMPSSWKVTTFKLFSLVTIQVLWHSKHDPHRAQRVNSQLENRISTGNPVFFKR